MKKVNDHEQCIHCDVASCAHNDNEGMCVLQAIKVSPCPHSNSGKKADESMCSNYERFG